MSVLADIITAPSRAWTAAVDAVVKAKPKPRPPAIKKPTKVKKPKMLRPAVVAAGTENITLTGADGQSVRFTTGERLITEAKLNEVLQPLTQQLSEHDREFEEVDRDLDENDKATNSLVDEVNELQEENKAQHEAIQGLLNTTHDLAKELAEDNTLQKVPKKESGMDPMYLMSRRGNIDGMTLALLSGNGLGALTEVPLVQTENGNLVVDVLKVMMTMDLLGGLGIFGHTKELRAARESGDEQEAARLSKLVAEELQGFVDASVNKAVTAALS